MRQRRALPVRLARSRRVLSVQSRGGWQQNFRQHRTASPALAADLCPRVGPRHRRGQQRRKPCRGGAGCQRRQRVDSPMHTHTRARPGPREPLPTLPHLGQQGGLRRSPAARIVVAARQCIWPSLARAQSLDGRGPFAFRPCWLPCRGIPRQEDRREAQCHAPLARRRRSALRAIAETGSLVATGRIRRTIHGRSRPAASRSRGGRCRKKGNPLAHLRQFSSVDTFQESALPLVLLNLFECVTQARM